MPNQDFQRLFSELPAIAQLQNRNPKAHRHDPNAPARVLTPNRLQIELHPSNSKWSTDGALNITKARLAYYYNGFDA